MEIASILSKKALVELRSIVEAEIGKGKASLLTDDELTQYGLFLLTMFTEGLKLKNNETNPQMQG